ncbi:MAG: glycosyltransferase [Rhodobacteraceae bacterium HLUCCO18]|nr:MAG: glycosyltransferase [Rhodobacteraceae bacterium HLUCCO18]
MSGPGRKRTGTPGVSTGGSMEGRFYRIADIYERARQEAGADDTITLPWRAERRPQPFVPPDPLPPEVDALWPLRTRPTKALRPNPGHGAPHAATAHGTLFVTLFGLTEERLKMAVHRIERQIRPSQDMRPVFLTDHLDTTVFRHAGFTYEYFPPSVFGAEAQAPLFARRFETLWRKWAGAMLIDFSASGYLARRIDNLEEYINREMVGLDRFDPRLPKAPSRPKPVTDVVALRAEYMSAGLDEVPDTFVLYRVLGNDLPPRHEVGQTLANLRFMLDHEPALEACEKRWIVNRIVDPAQEAAIIALLEERGQSYLRIPFDLEAYGRVGWDLHSFPDEAFFLRGRYGQMSTYDQLRAQAHVRRFKNNYVINNNGARNAALRDGKGRAKWVLPWDGNCFLTAQAWSEIVTAVRARPYMKYFTVPMARATDNQALLDPDYRPEPDSEPQMLFRSDSGEEFDEAHYYGRRPKVELFYRLGIPGPWDRFYDDVWDLPRPDLSEDAGAAGQAGWVARLFSGQGRLETEGGSALRARGEARIAAITEMLDRLDVEAMKLTYRPESLVSYDEGAVRALAGAVEGTPERRLQDRLVLEADLALQRGPYSVVNKSDLPPGGDRHDYYHPAPYWWPNPATSNGYPFVFRDGERVPGTQLYEPESARYDRTRLQFMFDDTTTLALAWLATGRDAYIGHAADLVRRWFLDPETRMAPHLTYAQVRGRWPGDTGAKSGLIEMKDLYYFLDAVRLVERAGALSEEEKEGFRAWLRDYLGWLQTSEQGLAERATRNNHGTCYDLQTGSIAAFLGDAELLERTFLTSRERILEQFTADGQQPHEMTRTQTAHYCCFNLQCWVNLATLASACGHDLWSFEGPDGRGIARAFAWLLPHMAMEDWPYQQIEPFHRGRFLPLFFAARDAAGAVGSRFLAPSVCDPLYFPHDGVKPYWMLGRSPGRRPSAGTWDEVARGLSALAPTVVDWFEAVEEPLDAAGLEARLWGGFSDSALTGLRRMRTAVEAGPEEQDAATRVLAKWAFCQGAHDEALALADAIRPVSATDRREHALMRAACLAATGETAEADRILRARLEVHPHDPDFCLLMANLARSGSGADDGWTEWLNRLYRRAGLHGLLEGADGRVGWSWPQASDAEGAGRSADDEVPRVTIILTPPSGEACPETTLASARSQSWGNLEILVVDRSGDAGIAADLAARAEADPRVRVLTCPVDAPEHVARNMAVERATGAFVTRLAAGECAHPMKIALQAEALVRYGVKATRTRHVRMSPEGETLVGWSKGPQLLQDNPASLMIATDMLRACGGWDAVTDDPDALLVWRLQNSGDLTEPHLVCPDVPLSLSISEVHMAVPPCPMRGPGAARDAETLLRHRARAAVQAPEVEPETDATLAALPPLSPADGLDIVYVGDFATGTAGLDHILAAIEAETLGTARIGLFHWPDYASDWRSDPDGRVLDLIAAGRVRWVHAYEPARAGRVVLCQTHMIGHRIDGLPDFRADRVEVLAGPQLRAAVPPSAMGRHQPCEPEIERLFSGDVSWKAI